MFQAFEQAAPQSVNTFGQALKYWRNQRGHSQLSLSLASDVSQRHISFLESGRAQPTRTMVKRLAAVLEISLREQNKLLTTAGFEPVYSELDLAAAEMAPVRQAIAFMLRQQEPYPAFVIDRYWQLVQANQAATRLMDWLLEGTTLTSPAQPLNLMQLMLDPQGLKPYVANWDAIAPHLIQRLRRESQAGPGQPNEAVFKKLLADFPAAVSQSLPAPDWNLPLLTVDFSKANRCLSFFTTITTLGTPYDITLQELRIESMFPANPSTEQDMQSLHQGES
ncbi:helix-turn-helix transcriptional regulator [Romeria aff. gracilis LEGE 07310]|uniref:Helix-turn-helix transcriptional regulator n=1 Tax=Vasconcelosia minhoensis LEGE 07310 TaxID=915328 RepID=A0A8J7ALN5_9CYAN|nr:helix-turn-helix transcriptional regulator [Romeria gracilis]MBE9076501.1 helix-turn-helix transcriptional regulator [Romeria aff. gracilis LEGE 07310]